MVVLCEQLPSFQIENSQMPFGAHIDWFPIRLSFAVASAATLIALVAGSALAWLLARKRFPGRNVIDSVITLPLVLPPTVGGACSLAYSWMVQKLQSSVGSTMVWL